MGVENPKIITDSTASLSAELAQRSNIDVVPAVIIAGNTTYRDGIDIGINELLRLLKTGEFPTTAAPAPKIFQDIYEKYPKQQILSVHLGSEFSAIYNTAVCAANELDPERICIYDTGTVSIGIGFMVLHAAEMAKKGANIRQIKIELDDLKTRLTVIATLDTLKYLEKGGRASRTQALFGTLLQVKPIIEVDHNEIKVVERPRTRRESLRRLVELTENLQPLTRVGVLHAGAPEAAYEVASNIQQFFQGGIFMGDIGAVLTVHAGPGVVGVCAISAR